jgi:hypothetical protein
MDDDFCKSVLPIPQYQNTCWFTAILMCFLKSQNSRRLLLSKLKINDKSPKVMKTIYKLLVKTYIAKPEIYKYFENFDLHKFLKYFISNKDIIDYIIKNGNNSPLFLPLFTKSIGIKSLALYTFDTTDDIYAGYYEYNFNSWYNLPIPTQEEYKKKLDIEFSKKITPDYIFISVFSKSFNNNYLNMCIIDNFKNIKYDKNLKLLKDFKFNGNYYKLDSCILNNYNSNQIINAKKKFKMQTHSIAGITCKNNKYVYNGWIKSTKDPAMLTKNVNALPCELIKHDWDVNNKNDEFCLNPITCKLVNINPKNLCFSFGKGYRTLIFVKTEKEFISNDENISNSSSLIYPSNTNSTNSIHSISIPKTNPLCEEWFKNKNINPETKRKIKDTSHIYKKYLKLCGSNKNNNDDIKKDNDDDKNDKNKKLCKEWIKAKNINPETKRKIKDTSPIYKKYIKLCNKFI